MESYGENNELDISSLNFSLLKDNDTMLETINEIDEFEFESTKYLNQELSSILSELSITKEITKAPI